MGTVAAAAIAASMRTTRQTVGLSAIDQPGINVVVLQRELSPALGAEAERVLRREVFRMVTVVTASLDGQRDLSAQLAGFPNLAADISHWSEVLADLTGCTTTGVRLAVVDRAMCPRLHVDNVTVRLVSAYVGPGTQFLDNADVDRSVLGHEARAAQDDDSAVLGRPALIHAAGGGDIVLLKGERWPGNQGQGAVHRSPAAGATNPRLVLTLDPLDN